MLDLLKARKSNFFAMLVVVLGFTVLPACSSTDEAEEDTGYESPEGTCDSRDPNFEQCMEDLEGEDAITP